MAGLYTGATGLWGGFAGLLYGSTSLSTPPGLLADVGASFSPASLFAAGEPGVWYDPSDFSTMFQDRAGTTPVTAVEQPVGLLLDKSQGLVLGPELVSNGTFDTDIAGWTQIAGGSSVWDASGGIACTDVAGADSNAQTNITTVAGRTYLAEWTVRSVTGGGQWLFRIRNSTDYQRSEVGVTGTYRAYFVASVTGTNTVNLISASTGQTVVFDNISVKELPGNHATQATSASRPVLSARVNLLTKTEQFNNAVWSKGLGMTVSPDDAVAPDGTKTADLITRGSATVGGYLTISGGTFVVGAPMTLSAFVKKSNWRYVGLRINTSFSGASELIPFYDFDTDTLSNNGIANASIVRTLLADGWVRLVLTYTPTTTTGFTSLNIVNSVGAALVVGAGTEAALFWGADLRVANDGVNLPVYQRVNTSTDYDTTGFPYYLSFDGSDDSMATNTITPGIDKAQVFAGVRKLSDAAQGVVAEMSATIASNNGTLLLAAPDAASATFAFDSKGTTQVDAIASSLTAPLTSVVTGIGDISGDTAIIRINGVQADQETSDQGTGNFLAYPLYIGRRNGVSLPFNGRIYSLITRFGANLDATTITDTEAWVNGKTKAY
jgi:hypothetical protein